MFLPQIQELGFNLREDEESGLLTQFPDKIRRTVGQLVIAHCIGPGKEQMELFCSHQHLKFVMEIVGQSLGLDIQSASIIEGAIKFYASWLNEPETRPPLFAEKEEHYILEIIRHFTLLFEPERSDGGTGSTDNHAHLCHFVYDTLNDFSMIGHDYLSLEGWEELLILVLGMTDNILSKPQSVLSSELCSKSIRVLWNIWIRSKTINDNLWLKMKELVLLWRERLAIINQWGVNILAISDCVFNSLYNEKTPDVILQFEGPQGAIDQFSLSLEYLQYIWYRFLYIFDDLETIDNPTAYHTCMKIVHNLTDLLLNIYIPYHPEGKHAPDGNTILNLLGPFLFESTNKLRPGFERGVAECLMALLKIFTVKCDTEFKQIYLACLYRGIIMGIQHHNLLLDIILVNSTEFILCELPGSRILMSVYLWAIEQILVTYQGARIMSDTVSKPDELRLASYKIINYFFGIQGVFSGTDIYKGDLLSENCIPSVLTYNDLNAMLDVIVGMIKMETNNDNIVYLIWLLMLYIEENIDTCKSLPMTFANIVIPKLRTWNPVITTKALQALTDMAIIFHHLEEEEAELGLFIVRHLCSYLEQQTKKQQRHEELILAIYKCIERWCCTGQWIFETLKQGPGKRPIISRVLELVTIGLTGKMGHVTQQAYLRDKDGKKQTAPSNEVDYFHGAPPPESIQHAAQRVMTTLMLRVGSFPGNYGPSIIDCLPKEDDVLDRVGIESRNNIGVYTIDEKIITIVRHPRDDNDNSFLCTLIVRDYTGRYVWKMKLLYDEVDQDPGNTSLPETTSWSVVYEDPETPDEDLLRDLSIFLDENQSQFVQSITQTIKNNYQKLVEKGCINKNVELAQPPALPQVDEIPDNTAARLLLSHLGLLDIRNNNRVTCLKPLNSKDDRNWEDFFDPIDDMPIRQVLSTGILYVGDGYNQETILNQQPNDPRYDKFISKLGWEIDVTKHNGATGKLNPEITGTTTRYYANVFSEIVHHIATNMPKDEDNTHIVNTVLKQDILIVWVEKVSLFQMSLLNTLATMVVFVIPLPSGVYRIRIFTPDQCIGEFGPILDNMIVTEHLLSTTLHQLCIGYGDYNSRMGIELSERKDYIKDWIDAYSDEVQIHSLYSDSFVYERKQASD
eukprot:TRINITY_DN8389_c0_g1_i1.p1 TRINITY_DN8389_c0_g1~~TRINITY_DN8389_c0_g1_i1.p1  ORF type:complete len:1133 (-),score=210.29 TRINITY_DN8389_c0_g1_i1:54-3452(-)